MSKIKSVKISLKTVMADGLCHSYDDLMKQARLLALQVLNITPGDEDLCGLQAWIHVDVRTGGKKKGVKPL